MNNLTHTTLRVLETAPVALESVTDKLSAGDCVRVIGELDALLQKAALVRGYLDERSGHGCGDQGHPAAVRSANRLLRRTRQILGFSYPDQPINF